MTFLQRLFGPSRETIWRQLAEEIDAIYVDEWRGDRVVASHDGWRVTLDTEHNPATKVSDTRMRARFSNPSDFRFTIYRKGLLSGLATHLGMQDVEVGHEAFDREFVIKGNDEHRLKRLFGNARIRALLEAQPAVHFAVVEPGWFDGEKEEGKDWLVFTVSGVLKDQARLKGLFDLFAETLDEIVQRRRTQDEG